MKEIAESLEKKLLELQTLRATWEDATKAVLTMGVATGIALLESKEQLREWTRQQGRERAKAGGNAVATTGREWTEMLEGVAEKFGFSVDRLWALMRLAKVAKADPESLKNAHTINEAMKMCGILPQSPAQGARGPLALPQRFDAQLEKFGAMFTLALPEIPEHRRREAASQLRKWADEIEGCDAA